jgi:hypothetical protein
MSLLEHKVTSYNLTTLMINQLIELFGLQHRGSGDTEANVNSSGPLTGPSRIGFSWEILEF